MSLARKSSSTDEFYDAVESMDEIPSSSHEDFRDNNVEANANCDSSDEENSENEAATSADNNNLIGSSENASETSSTNRLSESGENWVSARCLLDNNNTVEHGHHRDSREEKNNRASSRCLLENAPSLMDAVSSSISHEEVDRGERQAALRTDSIQSADMEVDETKHCAEKQSGDEPSNSEDQTNIINNAQQQSETDIQQIPNSTVHDENHDVSTGECCSTIEHTSLYQHEQDIDSSLVENAEIHSEKKDINMQNDHRQPSTTENKITDTTFILNTATIHSSKEESSCFDRESDNGFLSVDSDSIIASNTELQIPTQHTDRDNNDKKNDSSHHSTPLQHSTKKTIIDDCSVLDYCDLTSPLEALYLMCSNAKRGGTLLKRESMEELLNDVDETRSPERMTSSRDVDPVGAAPLSPPDNYNLVEESDSDDDSSSASPSKFRIVDKDTGGVFDMRRVMKDINEAGETVAFDTKYSFLPSKRDLQLSISAANGSHDSPCINDRDEAVGSVPLASSTFDTQGSVSFRDFPDIPSSSSMDSSTKRKTKFSSLTRSVANKLHKPSFNRSRTTSADSMPGNAIYVKSSSRHILTKASSSDLPNSQHSSSFNPMLLVKTTLKCHEGPAWCASFSLDGRFLATGGEDGNVCIWTIAPKSAVLHPGGAGLAKKDVKKEHDSHKEENREDADPAGIRSPPTTDSNERDGEKVGIGETSSNESAPPLNFIGTGPELGTNLEIISSTPLQRFQDHQADVIDLSWSHTNFLLTASLDSSVRLYHHSKSHCLHLFKHADLVASVAFHPNDERYFISGGIDKKLRLWSIPDGRVKDWAQAPDVITALRYTPDGRYAVAGLFRGQCYFYDSLGLKYYTQIACRNRNGRYKMGRKVTGISFIRGERDDWKRKNSIQESDTSSALENSFNKLTEAGTRVVKRMSSPFKGVEAEALRYTERMLVSTNDSRVRLYGLNDFCLIRKYKGHSNETMQIRARLSESGDFIASGSESGHVFLWNTLDKKQKHTISTKLHKTKDKAKSSDYFEASKAQLPITDTLFFPYKSVKEALLTSQIFPFQFSMDRVDDDLSSAAMLTLDYDGTLRVFMKKSCVDKLLDTATPRGGQLA